MPKKYKIGYTTGVFDMFHVGHLNILKRAKEQCEYLIVGVSTDELVENYKNKKTIIPFEDRVEILKAIKYVDQVVPQETMNKMNAHEKYRFNVMFVGDDWKNTEKWNKLEEELASIGVDLVYFPYTKRVSSTILREKISDDSAVGAK